MNLTMEIRKDDLKTFLMKSQVLSWFSYSLVIVSLLVLIMAPRASSHLQESYEACDSSFTCGTITGIQYPFARHDDPIYCGYPGFELDCNGSSSPSIDINNMTYHVLGIDQTSQILKIVREDVMESICPHNFVNTTINHELFDYSSMYMNITFLYGCPESFNLHGAHLNPFSCDDNGIDKVLILPGEQGPGSCNESVIIPVPVTALESSGLVNSTSLDQVLRGGFEVRWKLDATACKQCTQSNGRCFYNYDTNQTMCACTDPPLIANACNMANTTGASSSPKRKSLTIVLPIVGGLLATVGISSGIFICRQRKKSQAIKADETRSKDSVTAVSSKRLATNFLANITCTSSPTEFGNSTYFGTQVFTYDELEAATNGFDDSRELGDGGFGTVYYGKLMDGREVAVKRLYKNSFKRVEQFMNEVEILTMLYHENLVKLYGCTSRRSRELLLVYEYIANGTVADHLHGKLANTNSNLTCLNWSLRLNIAIETAEALAYLHESDIIHRDVKTSNILLDNNFCVKVADFGLSRFFPMDATHVSTAPQGTPGYVDPEYYQCYRLTDKSDVYSFGVVLMELLSSLQAVDTSRHRHDINLANMAIDRIQNRRLVELVDPEIGFERDVVVRRTATLVAELGFRCLQHEKDMRPTMREVVEKLRGIQDEELNVEKPEVVDIVVDDGGNMSSFDSGTTAKT